MPDTFIQPGMHFSLHLFPEPKAKRKAVLKVKCLREAFCIGSKGALVSWWRTRERFQLGTPCLPLGLSLWKLSNKRVRFSYLLISNLSLRTISAMAVLYPSIVLGRSFLSLKRCNRKSAIWVTEGDRKSTSFDLHHLTKMTHFDLQTAMGKSLWGASLLVATLSENPGFWMTQALGAKHVGSGS